MEQKYIILSRYEYWAREGKTWTKWFVHQLTPMTKDECEKIIDETEKKYAYIDQKTKLNHEYMLKDYNEYLKEQDEKKAQLSEMNDKYNEYYKSAEYKELQMKKRQSAKERKERQKKYIEERPV